MTISSIMKRMIAYSEGNVGDIDHLIKVWGYAKTIGALEGLDEQTQFILEAAAITHDIACPLCRRKYGTTAGPLQEAEGALLVADFLKDAGLTSEQLHRICHLVGHHHTPSEIDGADYQILIEADYLVNACENGYPPQEIRAFSQRFFKTKAGLDILRSIFTF